QLTETFPTRSTDPSSSIFPPVIQIERTGVPSGGRARRGQPARSPLLLPVEAAPDPVPLAPTKEALIPRRPLSPAGRAAGIPPAPVNPGRAAPLGSLPRPAAPRSVSPAPARLKEGGGRKQVAVEAPDDLRMATSDTSWLPAGLVNLHASSSLLF
ncbi:unnamed protein product, partial [Urochloa humidicola]